MDGITRGMALLPIWPADLAGLAAAQKFTGRPVLVRESTNRGQPLGSGEQTFLPLGSPQEPFHGLRVKFHAQAWAIRQMHDAVYDPGLVRHEFTPQRRFRHLRRQKLEIRTVRGYCR
jgi:hypothetical protein